MPTSIDRPFRLSDFDFQLPPDLIAQHPSTERSGSKLLDARDPLQPVDRIFRELPDLLQAGDLLVFNDTQVVNARLFGEKASGGQLELLIERVLPDVAGEAPNRVVAHMKVSKKPAPGARLMMWDRTGRRHAFDATLLGRWPDDNGALFLLSLSDDPHRLMAAHGHMPLPPYIDRQQKTASATDRDQDAQRYQTVFAKHPGSAAAPTAA
jgi:S-adenosylmethionine:tRNA ribosyltransferase-isomerase